MFPNMLTHAAEGEGSGEPTEPQPTPSPTQPSIGDQSPKTSSSHATTQDSRDSLEGTNGNERDQVQTSHDSPLSGGHTSDRAKEISVLKSRIKKLEKKCKPSISYHKAWLKSMKRLSMKKRFGKREFYMGIKEAMDKGMQSGETEEVKLTDDTKVVKDKGSGDKGGNVEELVSTARPKVSTARPDIDAARQEYSMKEEKAKEKGVSIKDVDDSLRPARSILTLKPLPIIDPKDKGKGVLMESPTKKVKRSDLDAAQIAKDAKILRLVLHEKELAEMEKEREERPETGSSSCGLSLKSFFVKVLSKMDASEELAARLQMEEREMYIIEERSKLLAEFFERRKKLLAEERVAAEQERDADFVPIGTERDEKMIDKMNKKAVGLDEKRFLKNLKALRLKLSRKDERVIRKRLGRRLKMKATKKSKRQKTDSDLEEEEQLRASLKIVPDEEEEINYEVLGMRVHILALEDGTEIHMLAERRYLLIRETLERMMELRLTAESEGEAVFDLLRFIQK
ncbi:hypothetical protein Tco_0226666 [Tanacetum coccineum]